jgi:hypothetical protein
MFQMHRCSIDKVDSLALRTMVKDVSGFDILSSHQERRGMAA